MDIPIWLDICNTCGVSRIIRNVNLYAYAEKEEVAVFTQIQRSGEGQEKITLGDNESYTLIIPPNSARRFDLEFILHEQEMPPGKREFNEIILSYFDERNNIKAFHFLNLNSCWIEGSLIRGKQWIDLDKKCPYAK